MASKLYLTVPMVQNFWRRAKFLSIVSGLLALWISGCGETRISESPQDYPTANSVALAQTSGEPLATGYVKSLLHLGSTYASRIDGGTINTDYFSGLGGEANLKPKAGDSIAISGGTSSPLTWTPLTRTNGMWGQSNADDFLQYHAIAIYSATAQTVALKYRVDNKARGWMDGQSVLVADAADGGSEKTTSTFNLSSGWHQFVFKHRESKGNNYFAFRFVSASGADLSDLMWAYQLPTIDNPHPPTPVITLAPQTGSLGMAPFTVHVHAINSVAGVGSLMTARIRWDFIDSNGLPDGTYSTLSGFNAAHTFDQPGAYKVKLTITNEGMASASTMLNVDVSPDTRSKIYVAANGSDTNPGTLSAPIKSTAKAKSMLANNTEILFRRGDTFAISSADQFLDVGTMTNVLIGAYGSTTNPRPILSYTGDWNWSGFVKATAASNVIVQDLDCRTSETTPHSPNPTNSSLPGTVAGVNLGGKNITVRRSRFDQVGTVFGGYLQGFLAESVDATTIGGYFFYGDGGADGVILNSSLFDSIDQHGVRMYANRILLHDNTIRNPGKTTISTAASDYFYASSNRLLVGRIRFGYDTGYYPGRHIVFEGNEIKDCDQVGFEIYPSKDIFVRNNTIETDGTDSISLYGYDSHWASNPSSSNVWIVNNTAVNHGDTGAFVRLGGNPSPGNLVTIANNFYVQPQLQWHPQGWFPANVMTNETSTLVGYSLHHNIWQTPVAGYNCPHRIGGCTTATQYGSFPETQAATELYHSLLPSQLGAHFSPPQNSKPDNAGTAIPGVHFDFSGNPRPATGITSGAVQLP